MPQAVARHAERELEGILRQLDEILRLDGVVGRVAAVGRVARIVLLEDCVEFALHNVRLSVHPKTRMVSNVVCSIYTIMSDGMQMRAALRGGGGKSARCTLAEQAHT